MLVSVSLSVVGLLWPLDDTLTRLLARLLARALTPHSLTHSLTHSLQVPSLASHLDWVLVTVSLSVVGLLWPLDDTQQADRRLPHSRTGLPNATHPSDHLPLGVKLRVVPAGALQD